MRHWLGELVHEVSCRVLPRSALSRPHQHSLALHLDCEAPGEKVRGSRRPSVAALGSRTIRPEQWCKDEYVSGHEHMALFVLEAGYGWRRCWQRQGARKLIKINVSLALAALLRNFSNEWRWLARYVGSKPLTRTRMMAKTTASRESAKAESSNSWISGLLRARLKGACGSWQRPAPPLIESRELRVGVKPAVARGRRPPSCARLGLVRGKVVDQVVWFARQTSNSHHRHRNHRLYQQDKSCRRNSPQLQAPH